jgi:signal transduction histidine kinase
MGGTVDVESELGVGSSFKIQIPAAPRRPADPGLTSLAKAS